VSQLSPTQQQLDELTQGAFSAPTSGERAAKLRAWLGTEPSDADMAAVYKELSLRDKGAAKALKEKLDDLKRAKGQEAIAVEWAHKAQTLLAASKLNIADALAWQRDAAKAGAPLSKEPLSVLKQQLTERTKAIEDLQTRVQVHREAAVLLAQRIEVLSTKPLADVRAAQDTLPVDVQHWQEVAQSLAGDAQWPSIDPKFPVQIETSRSQLLAVWNAFQAALSQAESAALDAAAPLPPVPVWADEIRAQRGEAAPEKPVRESKPKMDPAQLKELQDKANAAVRELLDGLKKQVEEGHTKAVPKIAHDLRDALKAHHKFLDAALDAEAHATLSQAGELEGWQRWRADQLRQELVAKASELKDKPLGGRKQQEALRALREQWKTTDQGGAPNHALWKKFDEACNEAHKVVETWLEEIKAKSEAAKGERLALIEEVKAWTAAHASSGDWKAQIRDLHQFSERWRNLGHLSEKAYAEMQPLWKQAVSLAHGPLEAAQQQSRERRSAMIEEAKALGAAPALRIDAVKELQQRWQAEAVAVPLERKVEQKLWEVFRKPIDEAFQRKSAERDKHVAALTAHDQAVINATKAVDAAVAAGDAAAIRTALAALEAATRGQTAPMPEAPGNESAPAAEAPVAAEAPAATEAVATENTEEAASESAAPAKPAAPVKPLVAMRGDDRPGMKKTEPASDKFGRGPKGGKFADRGRPERRDDPRRSDDRRADRGDRPDRFERGPRLGDAAFRAQRDAMERAQQQLKKLAALAHGETLTQLMSAWSERQGEAVPAAQQLGSRITPAQRQAWVQSLNAAPQAAASEPLLRLEMAAEVPTPAEHVNDRRALQLQLLTRRNDPAPAQTWAQDAAKVLASAHNEAQARRLMACLKVLLRKPA
jgi:ATP-dependent RNA helicase SUPV3L1/SUV3